MDNGKKPPQLVDLAKQREDSVEAARAKQSRTVAGILAEAQANRPMRLELMAFQAREWHDRFPALQKAGFTPEQALQLCWRQP